MLFSSMTRPAAVDQRRSGWRSTKHEGSQKRRIRGRIQEREADRELKEARGVADPGALYSDVDLEPANPRDGLEAFAAAG